MPSRPRACACLVAVAAALAFAGSAAGAGQSGVAALQVGLSARGLYAGTIDGVAGRTTTTAVRAFQRRAHLPVDGIAGPRTRAALGRYGRHALGSRPLAVRAFGWDVAELQFLLAWHGFPSGPFDGRFGARTAGALRRFQRFAGLRPDGVASSGTLAALHAPLLRLPISLAWPLRGPIGSPFGPRGYGFHAGVDVIVKTMGSRLTRLKPRSGFCAETGAAISIFLPTLLGLPVSTTHAIAGSIAGVGSVTRVKAVRWGVAGRVVWAGYRAGGWGLLVTIAHRDGVRTMYAHLSRVGVQVGQRVGAGERVGRVGATGDANGPHLHFEVRLRGAAVDPLPALR